MSFMKPTALLLSVLFGAIITLRSAETPPPARTNQRPVPVRSPEVNGDHQVTFRLRAAKAAKVAVIGQWTNGAAPMARDSNDVWSVTVGPIATGIWEYGFQVDELSMIDPGNPAIKPMREPRTSILHLPGDPPLVWDFQEGPHGVVREHTYRAKALGRLRGLTVYTPPGYDQNRKTYPTLYLQHGSGDNQNTWTVHGKAHWILDNLIAEGRAKPMIIVMMDGHAATPGAPGDNTRLFERDLLEEVMPFIKANYRVKQGAANRAIVGLSMGGGQSLTIGLNHADTFAWVGGFSSATPSAESVATALNDSQALNKKLKLLWIACGKEDFLRQRNEEFRALLNAKSVKCEWHPTAGNHSWPIWRGYLADIVPKLFQ